MRVAFARQKTITTRERSSRAMEEKKPEATELRSIIRGVIEEFVQAVQKV